MSEFKKLSQKVIELNGHMLSMISDCYDDQGNVKKNVDAGKLDLTNKVKHDIVNNMMVFSSLMLTIKKED